MSDSDWGFGAAQCDGAGEESIPSTAQTTRNENPIELCVPSVSLELSFPRVTMLSMGK